jgi:hypothetical protein
MKEFANNRVNRKHSTYYVYDIIKGQRQPMQLKFKFLV